MSYMSAGRCGCSVYYKQLFPYVQLNERRIGGKDLVRRLKNHRLRLPFKFHKTRTLGIVNSSYENLASQLFGIPR